MWKQWIIWKGRGRGKNIHLHGKVKSHKLDDGSGSSESSSNSDSSESHFSNWSVDEPLVSIFIPESFRDLKNVNITDDRVYLVSSVVSGNFFSHDEDLLISSEFFV